MADISRPLAEYIDQTLLRPTAVAAEYTAMAERAAGHGFGAVCVSPWVVREVADVLRGARTRTQTVVGFPLGIQATDVKCFEAGSAVERGADEIDMVVNRGWARDGRYDRAAREITEVVRAVAPVPVKAILEISDLSHEEIMRLAEAAAEAGAAFVKTSTGFFGAGADVDTVRRIRAAMGDRIRIKASGGIRTLAAALEFIRAGADRIGTSSGEGIMEEHESGANS